MIFQQNSHHKIFRPQTPFKQQVSGKTKRNIISSGYTKCKTKSFKKLNAVLHITITCCYIKKLLYYFTIFHHRGKLSTTVHQRVELSNVTCN